MGSSALASAISLLTCVARACIIRPKESPMPPFPIIDAHLHLWDPHHFRMPWLDDIAMLNKPYGLAEYQQHTVGIDIEAMVYLQVEVSPAYGLLEVEWVKDRA